MLKILIAIVASMITSSVLAEETLLVCNGDRTQYAPDDRIEETDEQITLAIDGDYVEASDAGKVQFSNKEGNVWVWVWERKGNAEDFLYNLDVISGQLKKFVMVHMDDMKGIGKYKRVTLFQCHKVEKRLID